MLDHPNIVQILGLGQHDRNHFIVMEYVHGLSLSRLIKRVGGPLPLPVAVQIAIGVAAGLQYAHDAVDPSSGEQLNLVHRDISPPNILVSTSGDVKITDFGIAKVKWSTSRTRAGVVKGKYSYLSPEQVRGKKATRMSDLYSLGLNLYEMTTGQRAYPVGEHAEVLKAVARGRIEPPDRHVTDFPVDLEAVLMKVLAVNPRNRHGSCAELQEDLIALMQEWQVSMPPSRVGAFVQQVLRGEPITELPAIEGPTEPGIGTPSGPTPIPVDAEADEDDAFKPLDETPDDMLHQQDTQIVKMTTVHLTPPVVELPPETAPVTELPATDEEPLPVAAAPPSPALAGVITDARRLPPAEEPAEELDLTDPTLKTRPVFSRRALLMIPALLLACGAVGALWWVLAPDGPASDPTGRAVPGNIVHSTRPTTVAGGPAATGTEPAPAQAQDAGGPSAAVPPDAAPIPDLPLVDLPSMPPPDLTPPAAPDAADEPPPAATKPRAPRRPRGPTSKLSISSDPRTWVYLRGRRIGLTPLKIRIPKKPTTLLMVARKHGIRTTRTITPRGDNISANFVFRKGKIGFRAARRCRVSLGRKKLGVTPIPPVEVYEGQHKVTLKELDSGNVHRQKVAVTPGRTVWVEVK